MRRIESLNIPSEQVGFIAHLKGVSEFELFKMAWNDWHRDRATDRTVEPAFDLFLARGEVPPWVRGYIRRELQDGKIMAREKEKQVRSLFIFYAPLGVFLLIFLFYAFH